MDSGELTAETLLRRARNLRLEVDSHNVVRVLKSRGTIDCGPRGLSILDAFHRPTTLAEGLNRLGMHLQGAQDWIDVSGVILGLYRSGVLKEASSTADGPGVADGSFSDPMAHAIMLNDRVRSSLFIEAVQRTIRPGDVVLDIGTGSGVLAVAAARTGAGRVYAIEAGDMSRTARAVFQANEVAERITLIEGWSTQVEIPERADVLVGEIIGEIPLEERILEVTLDARRRLLKPQARLIPKRLRILGFPVSVPAAMLRSRLITSEAVRRWSTWYGMDFGPLAEVAGGSSHVIFLDPESARKLPRISEPVLLAELDLGEFERIQVEGQATAAAGTEGDLNGVVVYFEVDLGASLSLSTDPDQTTVESSWRNPVWFYNEPLPLAAGERFAVSFSYRVPGQPNGVRISPG